MEEINGVIANFKLGGNNKDDKRVIVQLPSTLQLSNKIIGRKVIWISSSKKKFIGKIIKFHGRSNKKVIVEFRKGLPGQALGKKVIIV